MSRKTALSVLKTLLTLSAFGFLAWALYSSWIAFSQKGIPLRVEYLLGAALFCLAFFFVQALGWRFALVKMSADPGALPSCAIWFFSQVVKYVPGKVMLPLYRIVYSERKGVGKAPVLLALTIEIVMMIVSASLIFFVALPFLSMKLDDRLAIPLLVGCCILGIVGIHPKVMQFGVNLGLKLFKKDPVVIDFSFWTLIRLLLLFIFGWALYGVSAVFTVLALALPWGSPGAFVLAVSAGFAISWVVGFLSFLTPGGLGVREAILALILAPFLAGPTALAVAVISRVIWIGCEVAGFAITAYWLPRKKEAA